MSWLRLCRTVSPPLLLTAVMVQRSPFLTQSVAVEPESPVVAAGDDHISDTGPVSVGQGHLATASG